MAESKKAPFKIGSITYGTYTTLRRKIADSRFYYPKGTPAIKAHGLGCILDKLASRHLKKIGFTHMQTPADSEEPRAMQLRRVGLRTGRTYPIDDWIKAMTEGASLSIKKHWKTSKA